MTTVYDCVIVASGAFPTTARVVGLVRRAKAIIACDGAIGVLHAQGLAVEAIVGDLDSIPHPLGTHYADRIHHVADQETNDLTKALLYAARAGYRRPVVVGGTGLREDHALGNISLLLEHAPLFDRLEMVSDYGVFIPLLASATLACHPGQPVSLFALPPCGAISVEGVRWPVQERCLTAWWQGTLNQATGHSLTLRLTPSARILVYLAWPTEG